MLLIAYCNRHVLIVPIIDLTIGQGLSFDGVCNKVSLLAYTWWNIFILAFYNVLI